MNIDFGSIIQRSFEIAWRYKTLWIFGLFSGAGSRSFNTDVSDFTGDIGLGRSRLEDLGPLGEYLTDWNLPDEMIPAFIGALVLWFLALSLLFFICYLIAQPAIIDAVNKVTRGGQYSFGTSFSRGVDFFWRFFGITLVEVFAGLALATTIVILAIVLTPFSLLLTVPAAIVVIFFIFHTFSLAEVAMVARNNQIGDAIAEGWGLLMRNKANCFIMTLILIGLGIGFAIIITLAALIFFLPVNILVGILTGNIVAALLLAILIGLPISIVLGGYTGTFFNALYVQFYFRLVEPQPTQAVATPAAPSGPMA